MYSMGLLGISHNQGFSSSESMQGEVFIFRLRSIKKNTNHTKKTPTIKASYFRRE